MKPATCAFLSIALTIASCKKDDDCAAPATPSEPAPPLNVSAFSLLDSGNYWVYDRYRVDSLDVIDPTYYIRDSLRVIGDSVIGPNTYAVIQHFTNGGLYPGGTLLWRDSADFIVNQAGAAVFSSATFNQVIHVDSIPSPNSVVVRYQVSPVTGSVSVPAGDFTCYLVTGNVLTYGSFMPIATWKYPRTFWAAGVGRVKWYAYFFSGWTGYRYQLRSYHVQ